MILKSSIANPSSAPVALKSFHLIQKLLPAGIFRPVIVAETILLFNGSLPSNAPTAPVVTGAVKSKLLASIHAPVVKLIAEVLY